MTNPIASDDPTAPDQINDRLILLRSRQERYKATNAAWRKAGKPAPNDDAGWLKVAELLGGVAPSSLLPCREELARFPYHRQPYPAYRLTNNGANIKRLEERLKEIAGRASLVDSEEVREVAGLKVRVIQDVAESRIKLVFPGKPSESVRGRLKAYGFVWSPTNGAWQRFLNDNGIASANSVLNAIEALSKEVGSA